MQQDPREERAVGLNILRAGRAGFEPNYIERRTERLSVDEGMLLKRSVQLQIRLSELRDPKHWPRFHGAVPVPVARVIRPRSRNATSSLDLQMDGIPISWVPGKHERRLVIAGVLQFAQVALGMSAETKQKEIPLPDPLRADLVDAVNLPLVAQGGTGAAAECEDPIEKIGRHALGATLLKSEEFGYLLQDARKFFWITALVQNPMPTHAIFSYDYHLPLGLDSGGVNEGLMSVARRRPTRLFNPRPGVDFTFNAIDAGVARSFHIEFDAPLQLIAETASLTVENPQRSNYPVSAAGTTDGSSAHAFYDGGGPLLSGRFRVSVKPGITGTTQTLHGLSYATGAVMIVAAALSYRTKLDTLNDLDWNSLVPGLLLVPALLATTLAGRPTHPLASRMLMGIRATACFAAFSLALATLVSIPDWGSIWVYRTIWSVAAIVGAFSIVRACLEAREQATSTQKSSSNE